MIATSQLENWLLHFTDDWRNPVGAAAVAAALFVTLIYREQTRLVVRSVRRNLGRSALTGLATGVLVLVVTLVWSVLAFLDAQTVAKTKNFKAIVTERYQQPSQMPFAYAAKLSEGAPRNKGDYHVDPVKDSMFWAFYIGTLDPGKVTRESALFFFVMEPSKVLALDEHGEYTSMMDDVDQFTDEEKSHVLAWCREMEKYPDKVLMGPGRLAAINKKVGERVKVTSLNYKGIDLEVEILGVLPGGRYDQSAVMNYRYLDEAVQEYNKKRSKAEQHPMTEKSLALMFLRVPDTATFERVAGQVMSSPEFRTPAVKCETFSSGIASFFDSYKDLLFGMRWLLVPGVFFTMSIILANAISISVRQRRVEMAVLKVLGFSPNQILLLVLTEALAVGCVSGLLSGIAIQFFVNRVIGGLALTIAFFGKFFIDASAPWWGLGIGAATAFVGSIVPAWSARSVKVSEVFSKIA